MTRPRGRQGAPDEPDDTTLVQRTLAGDHGGFADLVRRYQGLVFRIVRGFLRNPADVEEVVQEAFVRAFAGLAGFRAGAPFGPWIARIAVTSSYDRLRQRRRTAEVGWEDLSPTERNVAEQLAQGRDPEETSAARDLAERALGRLAPRDQAALMLADGQGLTPTEVARIMGCSALAVRVRLHRARRAMRAAAEALLAGVEAPRKREDP